MADFEEKLDAFGRVISWPDQFVESLESCSDQACVASSSSTPFFFPDIPAVLTPSPLFVPLHSPSSRPTLPVVPQTDYLGVSIGSPVLDPRFEASRHSHHSSDSIPVKNSIAVTALQLSRPAWRILFPLLSSQRRLRLQQLIIASEKVGGRPRSPLAMEDKKTPSSVGDIEAAEPASISGAAAHLSVRADTDNVAHSHTAVHHAHSGPLLQPSHMAHADHGLMPTIQPSALTVENVRESSPGALRLGPSEYAVTLPMDSRVKDDYERAITDGAADMRAFLASLDPGLELTTRQVSHCV